MINLISLFVAESHRFWLWFPVATGLGVVSYFSLHTEPPLYLGLIGLALVALGWFFARKYPLSFFIFFLPLGFCLGFTAGQFRTYTIDAPKITQDYDARSIRGEVITYEVTANGPRLLLRPSYIQGLQDSELPHYIKVNIRAKGEVDTFLPGDRVRLWGFIKPNMGPAFEGAYDFERHSYFKGIGGVAFALGSIKLEERPVKKGIGLWVETIRTIVTGQIYTYLPGENGGLAAALITGHKEKIPQSTYDAYRDAGLAHLLAISGLHFGLIFGFIFFAVRFLLVLIPGFALRYPIKKWAIMVALLGAFGYSVLAGGSVPTIRAFIMLGLFSFAVLLDRLALSMYNVAWAAFLIILMMPEALLGPSFQMSFAAVIALISMYENHHAKPQDKDRGFISNSFFYMLALSGTSLVASLATTPYTIFHFGQFQLYGVAANLVAVPLAGIWIMPCALIALVLMPLGLEQLPLILMGWGIEVVSFMARLVASWPGAVMMTPMLTWFDMGLITMGALWFFIWKRGWRWAGFAPIAVGVVLLVLHDRPDIFVGNGGKLIAVREAQDLYISSDRRGGFVRKQWLTLAGCTKETCFPKSTSKLDDRYTGTQKMMCDKLGCVARVKDKIIALPKSAEALGQDCSEADVILAGFEGGDVCPDKITYLPGQAAGLGYLSNAGIKWVMPEEQARPWR